MTQNFKFVVNSKEMFEKMNDCEAEIQDVRVAFEDDLARWMNWMNSLNSPLSKCDLQERSCKYLQDPALFFLKQVSCKYLQVPATCWDLASSLARMDSRASQRFCAVTVLVLSNATLPCRPLNVQRSFSAPKRPLIYYAIKERLKSALKRSQYGHNLKKR